jgi:hypothetical protein
VLRFYGLQQRQWVGAWQEHQQQQWQVWAQQQQQCGSSCEDDSAAAAVDTTARALPTVTIADDSAHAAASAAATASQSIKSSVRPCSIAVNSSSSSSSSSCCDTTSSLKPQQVLEADVYCHAAASSISTQQQQHDAADSDDSQHPWSGLLDAVAGGRGYRGSRLLGPLLKHLWQQQQQQGEATGSSSNSRQQAEQHAKEEQQQQQHRDSAACTNSYQLQDLEKQQQQQQLLPLADIAERWLAQQEWQQLLGHICEVHGVCSSAELLHSGKLGGNNLGGNLIFPECGSDSLVFTVKNAAVKFVVGQPGLPGELAAAVEADTLWRLQQQQQQVLDQQGVRFERHKQQHQQKVWETEPAPTLVTPQLLGHGTVHIPYDSIGAATAAAVAGDNADDSCHIPYLVLSRVEGQGTAASLNCRLSQLQLQQLAVSCGKLLATLHALPLQQQQQQAAGACNSTGCSLTTPPAEIQHSGDSATAVAASAASKVTHSSRAKEQRRQQQQLLQQVLSGSFWRSREGTIWSYQLGCLTEHQQQQGASAAEAPARQAVAAAAAAVEAVELGSLQLDVHEMHQDQQQEQQQQQECGSADKSVALWQPFLQFLQQRRADVLQQLQQEQQQLLQLGTVASEIHARVAGAAAAVQTSAPLADAGSRSCSTVCGEANAVAAAAVNLPCIGVGEECLPSWLVQQLYAYIPEDLSSIVVPLVDAAGAAFDYDTAAAASAGSADRNGMSGRFPVRLHGDLMSGNLVLQLQQEAAHAVITEQHPCPTLQPAGSAAAGIQQGLFCNEVTAGAATAEPIRLQQSVPEGGEARMQMSHVEQQQNVQQQQQDAQQQGLQQVSFIDFADGGIGDPLYDFVAVFVSVLDCDVQLLQLALQSYASHLDVAAVWPARQSPSCSAPDGSALDCGAAAITDGCGRNEGAGSSSSSSSSSRSNTGWQCSGVSHAFMVYLLLHEEGGIVGQLLEKQPQLRACGGLQEMQQQLFGWMDDWWASCVQQQKSL